MNLVKAVSHLTPYTALGYLHVHDTRTTIHLHTPQGQANALGDAMNLVKAVHIYIVHVLHVAYLPAFITCNIKAWGEKPGKKAILLLCTCPSLGT